MKIIILRLLLTALCFALGMAAIENTQALLAIVFFFAGMGNLGNLLVTGGK